MEEEWIPIKDYENYMISNLGRVKNLNYKRTGRERMLKLNKDKNGYLIVSLIKNKKRKTFLIHRLVAKAFIPNPENKPCVDHINTIKTDNRVENLRWVTCEENMNNPLTKKHMDEVYASMKGMSSPFYGKKHTEESKRKMGVKIYCIELNKFFDTITEASEELNMSKQNIHRALNGKSKSAGRHPITGEKLHWRYVEN